METEEDKLFLEQVAYFWQEKGDCRRYIGFDLDKLEKIDPLLKVMLINYEVAKEALDNRCEKILSSN